MPELADGMADLVAAYVMGAVTPEEAEAVRAHVASCARCRELAYRLQPVVAHLSLAARENLPASRLRAKIMAASKNRRIPSGWGDEDLPLRSHICFYYSNEDWLRRSLGFLRVGLDAPGEMCLLVADISDHAYLLQVLQDGYPNEVTERVKEGKLVVDAPVPTGKKMGQGFADRFRQAVNAGYTTIRRMGLYPHHDRPGWPSPDELVNSEVGTDELAATFPSVVVCSYGPDVDPDVLRGENLHSHITVDGQTKLNPSYAGASGGW